MHVGTPPARSITAERVAPARTTTKEKPTVKVTMTTARRVAPDGVTLIRLTAGESYELPDRLAARLIERGQAEPTTPENTAPSRRSTRSRGGKS